MIVSRAKTAPPGSRVVGLRHPPRNCGTIQPNSAVVVSADRRKWPLNESTPKPNTYWTGVGAGARPCGGVGGLMVLRMKDLDHLRATRSTDPGTGLLAGAQVPHGPILRELTRP